MKNYSAKRNIGIDLLRGTSILYIVGFWHLLDYTKVLPNGINQITLRLTDIILGAFVFISGYFLASKKIELSIQSLMTFYRKRLLRIYPLYLIAICLFYIFHISDNIALAKAALAISMFMQPAPITLWFITMLIFFYLISPFIIVACRTMQIDKLFFYSTIVIICLLAYSHYTKLLDKRIILFLPAFISGALFANNKSYCNIYKSHIILIVMAICISASFVKTRYSTLNYLLMMPMVVICSAFIFNKSKQIEIKSKTAYRNILFLSYTSYCMYLFHRPIYIMMMSIYFPANIIMQAIYLVILVIPCILLFSFIIQKLYDILIDTMSSIMART
jgi:peptidoglycan/LPS O-acetylase OafA/YrhL